MDDEGDLQSSQESSQFPLEPISGATLFNIETSRRRELKRKGAARTGCKEIDDYVLGGGFERGCVVGLSSEEMDMALLLGLQTVAHSLVFATGGLQRVAIITTLTAPVILPQLRDAVRFQARAKLGQGSPDADALVRQCLQCISITPVFDIEGLWEVLNELEVRESSSSPRSDSGIENVLPESETEPGPEPEPEAKQSSSLSDPPSSPVTALPPLRTQRTEILDSEDEDEFELTSSPPAASCSASPQQPLLGPLDLSDPDPDPDPASQPKPPRENTHKQHLPGPPDLILITHFSTLLTALFTHRDKSSAHTSLQLLASHLRYLSRSSGPLVMLLNSTTSPSSKASEQPKPGGKQQQPESSKPLDPTLRSVFNPPSASHIGYGYGAASHVLSRRNKPAFGMTFGQFLDLHLLCTRVPRSRADAEAVFAPASSSQDRNAASVRHAWVVEVLLDDIGAWEGEGARERKTDREQRWGAVDVRYRMVVVDAFQAIETTLYNTSPIKPATGFGAWQV